MWSCFFYSEQMLFADSFWASTERSFDVRAKTRPWVNPLFAWNCAARRQSRPTFSSTISSIDACRSRSVCVPPQQRLRLLNQSRPYPSAVVRSAELAAAVHPASHPVATTIPSASTLIHSARSSHGLLPLQLSSSGHAYLLSGIPFWDIGSGKQEQQMCCCRSCR